MDRCGGAHRVEDEGHSDNGSELSVQRRDIPTTSHSWFPHVLGDRDQNADKGNAADNEPEPLNGGHHWHRGKVESGDIENCIENASGKSTRRTLLRIDSRRWEAGYMQNTHSQHRW